jgi:uncharacterized cofD-like protein
MSEKPKVVAIGGGTGLATLLRGMKHFPISLSGVVTMTDDGKSSGRLSREIGILPPGDVRKCLAALSNDEQLLTKLFEYRFSKGRGLSGHSLGNLLLTALADITGSFDAAVQASSKILSIKGGVLPSTLEHVSLIAKLKNGQQALGEVNTAILGHRFGINKMSITPKDVKANPTVVYYINNADLVVIGPGSFYTSIVPNLLIPEIREALEKSKAMKVFVCNISTERGETEGYTVERHIEELRSYIPKVKIDGVIVNSHVVSESSQEGKLGNVRNITTAQETVKGVPVVRADVVNVANPLYHDDKKLSNVIWQAFTKEPATV